jgi:hypothetical protein
VTADPFKTFREEHEQACSDFAEKSAFALSLTVRTLLETHPEMPGPVKASAILVAMTDGVVEIVRGLVSSDLGEDIINRLHARMLRSWRE